MLGLIKTDTFYFRSREEVECGTGQREPAWEVAGQELPRIRRICKAVSKWAKVPIKDLIQESLICVAVAPIEKKLYGHYLNLKLQGLLKNFVAKYKEVVAYYWKPFIHSVDNIALEEGITPDDSDIGSEENMIEDEQIKLLKRRVKKFKRTLTHKERIIFNSRLYGLEHKTLRDLEESGMSRSAIHRVEQDLKERFKMYLLTKG
jgi:hypothetical protein